MCLYSLLISIYKLIYKGWREGILWDIYIYRERGNIMGYIYIREREGLLWDRERERVLLWDG